MATPEMTVIIPCAGKGTRLGLPFPKELTPLGIGQLVIDSVLDLVAATRVRCRVLVIENGGRESTLGHIRARLPGIPVAAVRQPDGISDMPSAVRSVSGWFAAVNVVLLPDMVYRRHPRVADPLGELAAVTARRSFGFLAARLPAEAIADLGALNVAGDTADVPSTADLATADLATGDGLARVVAYEDKPQQPSRYNAAWAAFAFSDPDGISGLDIIDSSTRRQRRGPIEEEPIAGAGVVWLSEFRDCGTWARLAAEWASQPAETLTPPPPTESMV